MSYAERLDRCLLCGSEKIVTSVFDREQNRTIGWICKQCYEKLSLEERLKYLFGFEGYVSEEATVWELR